MASGSCRRMKAGQTDSFGESENANNVGAPARKKYASGPLQLGCGKKILPSHYGECPRLIVAPPGPYWSLKNTPSKNALFGRGQEAECLAEGRGRKSSSFP